MVPEKVKSKPCIIWTNFWQTRRISSPPPPFPRPWKNPCSALSLFHHLGSLQRRILCALRNLQRRFPWAPPVAENIQTFNLGFQFLGASVRCPVCHSTSCLVLISNCIPKRNKLLALCSSIGSSLLGSFEGNLWSPSSAKSPRKRENVLHVC